MHNVGIIISENLTSKENFNILGHYYNKYDALEWLLQYYVLIALILYLVLFI